MTGDALEIDFGVDYTAVFDLQSGSSNQVTAPDGITLTETGFTMFFDSLASEEEDMCLFNSTLSVDADPGWVIQGSGPGVITMVAGYAQHFNTSFYGFILVLNGTVNPGQAYPPAPGTTEWYAMTDWNNRGGPNGRKKRCNSNGGFDPATTLVITNNE